MRHNWDSKTFTDVATTITPISKIEKSEYMTTGLYPIISQEDSLISGYWNNPNDLTPHHAPVVIFGDHTRVLKYVDFEFAVGADGVKIIQPKDNLNAKFLYYYLHWLNVPSLGYSRHFKLIKEAKYSVPPLKVQEQIIAEFDKITEIINDCKEAIRNLDSLAQSLFYDYFGDPITNPKGWGTPKISECCNELYAGGDRPEDTTLDKTNENQIPVYSNGVANEGLYGYTSKARTFAPAITISGRGTIGVPFIRRNPFFPIVRLIVALPNSNIIEIRYLYYLLLFLDLGGNGAAIPQLTVPMVKDIIIPLPPLALQEKFAARIEQIEQQKKGLEEAIVNMQTLLHSRMDYWFN